MIDDPVARLEIFLEWREWTVWTERGGNGRGDMRGCEWYSGGRLRRNELGGLVGGGGGRIKEGVMKSCVRIGRFGRTQTRWGEEERRGKSSSISGLFWGIPGYSGMGSD